MIHNPTKKLKLLAIIFFIIVLLFNIYFQYEKLRLIKDQTEAIRNLTETNENLLKRFK